MTRNTHDMALDHHGTAVAEEIATGTATAGYVPVSTGVGAAPAWAAQSGGGSGLANLLTGDDVCFTASLGNWVNSGGTLTRDTTFANLFPNSTYNVSPGVLKLATTAGNQYAQVPVSGTFKAGHRYHGLLMIRREPTTFSSPNQEIGIAFGDSGASDFPSYGLSSSSVGISSWFPMLVDWTPTADRTSVTLRLYRANFGNTGNVTWYVGYAWVAEVPQGSPGLSAVEFLGSSWTNGAHYIGGEPVSFWPMGNGSQDGIVFAQNGDLTVQAGNNANLTGRGVNVNISSYTGTGDKSGDGVYISVGDDQIPLVIGEKDASTLQIHTPWTGTDIELAVPAGTTGNWKIRSEDDHFAIPALGMLPQYAADPTGVEGRMYYNTTTHKARCYNGTSWFDLF